MSDQGAQGGPDQFPPRPPYESGPAAPAQGWQVPGPAAPGQGWQVPGPPPPRAGGFSFPDFFTFRFMITPVLVEVIYLIGFVLITLFALGIMLAGGMSPIGVQGDTSVSGAAAVIGGLLVWVVGQLAFRVYMEVVIVLFRIHGSLESIDRRGRGM